MSGTEATLYEIRNGAAWITLNRPDNRNALSAILVTDSQDDLPLLQVVKQPCFVLWSGAKYVEPFKDLWVYAFLKRFKK